MFHVSPFRGRRGNFPAWFGFSWPEPIFQSWQAFNVDIKDAGDTYEITAELPGVPKENISDQTTATLPSPLSRKRTRKRMASTTSAGSGGRCTS